MDGLLVDSEPLWFRVERAFARDRGREWTEELARACVGRGLEATLATMGELFGFAVDPPRDRAEIVARFVARVDECEPKPGAEALLAAARARVPMALASSSPLELIEAVLRRFDWMGRFGAVVSGEHVARPKPAPDVFLRAADLLGVAPARAVVLEDSIAGATAGRAAGMIVIAVPEGPSEGRGFEEVADYVVPSLVEARALLDLD